MEQVSYKFSGLIAPCGMNCGTCIAYLREKKPCCGCLENCADKRKSCINCAIVTCELLAKTSSNFCFECEKFPCLRLKRLDQRYKKNYGMSMIENLQVIQSLGLAEFLEQEDSRWECGNCGSTVSAHRDTCLNCNVKVHRSKTGNYNHN